MIDSKTFQISLFPAICNATLTSGCLVVWLRVRRGIFPSKKTVFCYFSACTIGSIFASMVLAKDAHRRKNEAIKRMGYSIEGITSIQYRESGAARISSEEFDAATGVKGEEEVSKSFQQVS